MSVLQISVILLGVICVLNTVAVVALIRQVGVLHLRIQPVAGLTGAGGPEYGSELKLPARLGELARRDDAGRFLIAFVSPTCGICGPLTASFGRIARSAAADTAVLLVVDASEHDAADYVRAKGVSFLPYIGDKASFNDNVPGAPWAVVTDGSGKVIASGGVNTLDNIEEMLDRAGELIANPPDQAAPAEDALNYPVEVNGHVG
jgi:hypothetical protein